MNMNDSGSLMGKIWFIISFNEMAPIYHDDDDVTAKYVRERLKMSACMANLDTFGELVSETYENQIKWV